MHHVSKHLRRQFAGQTALKDFVGQIPAFATAKRTDLDNPGVGQRFHGCRHILTTVFATDGEIAETTCWHLEHRREYRRRKGENNPHFSIVLWNELQGARERDSLRILDNEHRGCTYRGLIAADLARCILDHKPPSLLFSITLPVRRLCSCG